MKIYHEAILISLIVFMLVTFTFWLGGLDFTIRSISLSMWVFTSTILSIASGFNYLIIFK